MKDKRRSASKHEIDARTFQHQLGKLANTIALKVEREGVKVMKPQFTAAPHGTYVLHRTLPVWVRLSE